MSEPNIMNPRPLCGGSIFLKPMYSDRDLKEKIQPIQDSSEIHKLKPVSFVMKKGTKLQFGFIAQDIEHTGLENIVFKNNQGLRTVAYTQIIPLLVHQIQSLTKRVAELEAQSNLHKPLI